ncbi:hypothetical protein TNCV_2342811 [Trichonephila clavipes]|nr:hypothetical protein TNCV_2342811 [Trichonephila clavipes]
MRAKAYCAYLSLRDLGAEMDVQMFCSNGQSDAKPPVFSFQASLVLIYQPTEGMKGRVNLAQPGICAPDLWRVSAIHYHSATGPPAILF